MQRTSSVTCPDRTSAAVRGSVMTGSGWRLGRQRPPDRCKRRMNSHIVNCLERQPELTPPGNDTSPQAHASSGWGEAPLYMQGGKGPHFGYLRTVTASSRRRLRGLRLRYRSGTQTGLIPECFQTGAIAAADRVDN